LLIVRCELSSNGKNVSSMDQARPSGFNCWRSRDTRIAFRAA
jgi:hypothetical protein